MASTRAVKVDAARANGSIVSAVDYTEQLRLLDLKMLPEHVIFRGQQAINYVTFDSTQDSLRRRQGQAKGV